MFVTFMTSFQAMQYEEHDNNFFLKGRIVAWFLNLTVTEIGV